MSATRRWLRRRRWQCTRPLARMYAAYRGYFFTPCPQCGISLGGHEWMSGHDIPTGPNRTQGICPPCAYEMGEPLSDLCATEGHDFSEVWQPERASFDYDGRQNNLAGSFDLRMPPAIVYCSRCAERFDPLTRAPLGRPLPNPVGMSS